MAKFLIYQITNKDNVKQIREKQTLVKKYQQGDLEALEDIRKIFIKLPPEDLYKHVGTATADTLIGAENVSADLKSENLLIEEEYQDLIRPLDIGDIIKPPKGTICYVKHRAGFDKMDTRDVQTDIAT
jgi:hypothetical protein